MFILPEACSELLLHQAARQAWRNTVRTDTGLPSGGSESAKPTGQDAGNQAERCPSVRNRNLIPEWFGEMEPKERRGEILRKAKKLM